MNNKGCLTFFIYLLLFIVALFLPSPYNLILLIVLIIYIRKHNKNIEKNKKVIIEQEKITELKRKDESERYGQEILKWPVWKREGYPSEEECLAQKEIELRKKENIYFLSKAYKQRKNITTFRQNLSTIDGLLKLSPVDFERWVKVNIFEKEGWTVAETKTTGDGGIDLVLTKNGEHSIAQCKRFRNTVGEPLLRDFYGAMMSEGVSKGFFITTGLFSLSALKFSEQKPIVLIDRRILAQRLGGDKK